MKKHGFTLMEMQAAMFIGLTVTALAGAFLTFEYERQFRVQRQAQLRMTARSIDATIQYACFQAVAVELSGDGALVYTADHIWQIKPDDILRNGVSLIDKRMAVHFQSFELTNTQLKLDLVLGEDFYREQVQYVYILDGGLVI